MGEEVGPVAVRYRRVRTRNRSTASPLFREAISRHYSRSLRLSESIHGLLRGSVNNNSLQNSVGWQIRCKLNCVGRVSDHANLFVIERDPNLLTKRHLATVRAALLYWKEEIAVYEPEIALPYLEDRSLRPLEVDEVEQLRIRFESVRYVAYSQKLDTLLSLEFLLTPREEDLILQEKSIATVILPS